MGYGFAETTLQLLASDVRRLPVFATDIVDPNLRQPVRSPPPQGVKLCFIVLAVVWARAR
jgi:hypothetical protein